MTYYIIYKITNLLNDKIYVGFHKTEDIYDDYMGSGKLIKEAIAEFGVQNFKKDIIAIFDNKDDAEALEAEIVTQRWTASDDAPPAKQLRQNVSHPSLHRPHRRCECEHPG